MKRKYQKCNKLKIYEIGKKKKSHCKDKNLRKEMQDTIENYDFLYRSEEEYVDIIEKKSERNNETEKNFEVFRPMYRLEEYESELV